MVGTLFLWVCWPSFNAALASDVHGEYRAVVNTYMALCACVMTAFALSSLMHRTGRLDMVHVQNATLAGGVIVGAVADMNIGVGPAMAMGAVAGALSSLGYHVFTPFFAKSLRIHDTCGVLNLHALPGVLSAVACRR